MIAAIITDLGSVFVDSEQLRTVSVARAYYLWSNFKSCYVSSSAFEKLAVPEYGTEEAASRKIGVIKGSEYLVLIRTVREDYLIRVGPSAEETMKLCEQITRGFWYQACSAGNMSYIDIRSEEDPNRIVTLVSRATTEELLLLMDEL